jgi:hypothetical protein
MSADTGKTTIRDPTEAHVRGGKPRTVRPYFLARRRLRSVALGEPFFSRYLLLSFLKLYKGS